MIINTLADCFSVVSKSGVQLEALNSLLIDKTKKSIDSIGGIVCIDEIKQDYECDESGWVVIGSILSIPLKEKGKKKPQRFVNFQISLMGECIDYPTNPTPLVFVSLWEIRASFKESEYMTLLLPDNCEVISGRLVQWDGDDQTNWPQQAWTFAVPLEKINSIEDVNAYIIQPLINLIKSKRTEEATEKALADTQALYMGWRKDTKAG